MCCISSRHLIKDKLPKNRGCFAVFKISKTQFLSFTLNLSIFNINRFLHNFPFSNPSKLVSSHNQHFSKSFKMSELIKLKDIRSKISTASFAAAHVFLRKKKKSSTEKDRKGPKDDWPIFIFANSWPIVVGRL